MHQAGIMPLLVIATCIHIVAISSRAEKNETHQLEERTRRSYDNHRTKHRGNSVNSGDVFLTMNSTVVTAQVGGTAILPCTVRKFNSGVVSWIRRSDYHLLTVGLTTYSSDERFSVEHMRHLQSWALKIKFTSQQDEGMYECQVSTHPTTSIFLQLNVIEAEAEISGAPDLHIKSGSSLRVVCSLRQSTEIPSYVFWYHDNRMINFESDRVFVTSDKAGSVLHISEAEKTDSGNYSCVPSNAKPASVNVHVLNGEKPAAMQHGGRSSSKILESSSQLTLFCIILYLTVIHSQVFGNQPISRILR